MVDGRWSTDDSPQSTGGGGFVVLGSWFLVNGMLLVKAVNLVTNADD